MATIPGKVIAAASLGVNQLTAAAQNTLKSPGRDILLPITAAITTDAAKASNTALPETPVPGSVAVFACTIKQQVGDGVKTADCYFSADNGATAKALTAIAAGDLLYFNAVIAGLNLAVGDSLNVTFRV